MEAARLPRAPNLSDLLRLALIAALLVLAGLAWWVTDVRMGGMDAGPGTPLGSFGFFVGVWVVMMAAMMFPSVWPMVLMYNRVQAGKEQRGGVAVTGGSTLLVAGYLLSWSIAGAVAYGIFEAVDALSIGFLAWDEGGPYVAGGVIVMAAIYQLTPLKDVCLRHCRNPLTYLMHHWRPGTAGALRMGVEHGGWCVGCCWALMAALFAVGIMSLGWMALFAAIIATEKLLPWKAVANRGIAVALIVLGLAVAFAPEDVPGLTIPGSPEAVEAMEAMGMEMEAMAPGESMEGGSMGSQEMEGSMGSQEMEGSMGSQAGSGQSKGGAAGMGMEP